MKTKEKGFALIAALMVTLLIMVFGVLALQMVGQDILMSACIVSEKGAMAAAETGVNQTLANFSPFDTSASVVSEVQSDAENNPSCVYSVSQPARTGSLTVPGESVESPLSVYSTTITGKNTATGSKAEVVVGIGYGPIPNSAGTSYN